MMDIGDTTHGDEWDVVEEPAEDRVETSVMDLINIPLLQLGIATLPSDEVPKNHQSNGTE